MPVGRSNVDRAVYQAAIVGCGRIGCFFDDEQPKRTGIWTHAGAYTASPRTRLIAVADVDPSARDRAAHRWGITRMYPDVASLLQHERVDILSVCTPSDTHADMIRAAAASGVSAVWCEKPMTATLTDADELIAREKLPIVAVNHIRRWDRAYQQTKTLVEQGRLGTIVSAVAWYTHGVANIGSHMIDVLRFLLGEVEWVCAVGGKADQPDPTLSGLVVFASGVVCHLVGCGSGMLLFELELVGTDARLRISQNGRRIEFWRVETSPRYAGYREPGSCEVIWEGEDGQRMLTALNDLVRCLDDQGTPRCTAEDGLKAVEVVAALRQSAAMGCRVTLPLRDAERHVAILMR